QEAATGPKTGPFPGALEGLGPHGHVIAFGLGIGGEGAAARLTARALGAWTIETTRDDVLVLVASMVAWPLHPPFVSLLCSFRHSPTLIILDK
ncbi:MAG TPA: hypothetical protein VFV38_18765, partial [Ktedonobacteraceae bacterium]|nr:hypothetical protein [Ktedonobacteraceae bacterium]